MKLRTYLAHLNPYTPITVKDRRIDYYEGRAGLCLNKKDIWDREILQIKIDKTTTHITLRIRRKRRY